MLEKNFVKYLEEGISKNWSSPALTDYKGEGFTYAEVAQHIDALHKYFSACGIQQGDKIALISKNSARWCIVYLAVVSYGAVIVPILPDFKTEDVYTIVDHSDSKILFCGEMVAQELDFDKFNYLSSIISLKNYSLLKAASEDCQNSIDLLEAMLNQDQLVKKEDFKLPDVENSNTAVISYTSGTTGFSKGVMIPHNSLAANVRYAQVHMPLNPGDPIVSFLPLAHTYGCAFEFLFPFSIGCHITILTKTPSPKIITQAFQEIRPALILSVPLVIEKIYKKQILPLISEGKLKYLIKIPLLNNLIYKKINKKLTTIFGGNFSEVVIGGAPFNAEAESFFKKIKFKFTVGYGMTECGPLISYASWKVNPPGASGLPVDTLMVKIDSPDPQKVPGEIILQGENVMQGYYKNPEATKEIIDDKGWLHTGDLGIRDNDGFVHILGRSKSLILGANGKNIYPEEIESAFSNFPLVSEMVVVMRNEKLVGIIYPDFEAMNALGYTKDDLKDVMETYRKEVNERFPGYMNVASIELREEEFEKTPKRSIKRFLYQ